MSHGSRQDNSIAYLAPRWLPVGQLSIAIDDLGFVQSATAVERLRTYGQRPQHVLPHLRRFFHSAQTLSIDGLPEHAELVRLLDELLRRNATWLAGQDEAGVTLFATPGRGGSDNLPTFGMHLSTLDQQAVLRRQRLGQPVVITNVQQPSPASWPRDIKVRCRLHYYLADQQAQRVDPQAVGLLLDEDGSVTETSVANVAIVSGGSIVSPPADRVLPGVTQAVAMRLAAAAGIPWQQRRLTVDAVRQADELLLLGTTTGIWPGRLIAAGGAAPSEAATAAGPICVTLQRAFEQSLVGG